MRTSSSTGLQHGPGRRDRVAAALHLDAVEIGPVLHVVVHVDFAGDHVARLEVLELVGSGADWLEVGRRVARFVAGIVGEQVLGQDHAARADKGVGPERRRLRELHHHRVGVDLFDRHVLVGGVGRRGGRRVLGVFPVEDDVVGGERLAIVPGDTLLEFPDDRLAIGRQRSVFAAGDRGRQHGLQVAGGIPAGQWLVEQPRAILVLGADREVRIEQGRTLPPQYLQRPAAAALGRLVDRRRLGHRHTRNRQELGRQRRREAHRRHALHEATPRQPAFFHIADQPAQFTFVHETLPSPC
jgi:hypothetical protein